MARWKDYTKSLDEQEMERLCSYKQFDSDLKQKQRRVADEIKRTKEARKAVMMATSPPFYRERNGLLAERKALMMEAKELKDKQLSSSFSGSLIDGLDVSATGDLQIGGSFVFDGESGEDATCLALFEKYADLPAHTPLRPEDRLKFLNMGMMNRLRFTEWKLRAVNAVLTNLHLDLYFPQAEGEFCASLFSHSGQLSHVTLTHLRKCYHLFRMEFPCIYSRGRTVSRSQRNSHRTHLSKGHEPRCWT